MRGNRAQSVVGSLLHAWPLAARDSRAVGGPGFSWFYRHVTQLVLRPLRMQRRRLSTEGGVQGRP